MDETAESYKSMLEIAKEKIDLVDFAQLRHAYTLTPEYSPYNDSSVILYRGKMTGAMVNKDYDSAIKYAECALKLNYLNIEAHMIIHEAQLALKNYARADKHREFADALLNSVLKSGDGLKPDTAYKVISIQEEYMVIGSMGAHTVKQVLVNGGTGKFFDVHEIARPNSDQKETIYFDISIAYRTLTNGSGRTNGDGKKRNRIKLFLKELRKK
jgi:tetratricopeptide (TPR) repeat protein